MGTRLSSNCVTYIKLGWSRNLISSLEIGIYSGHLFFPIWIFGAEGIKFGENDLCLLKLKKIKRFFSLIRASWEIFDSGDKSDVYNKLAVHIPCDILSGKTQVFNSSHVVTLYIFIAKWVSTETYKMHNEL